MLGMAAELHDRLVCSCGCGQWEADAHDPDKGDQWDVSTQTCYVRRAIDSYVKEFEPPADAVLSVRLVADRQEASRSEYEALVARFPGRFAAPAGPAVAEVDAARDDSNEHPQHD